MEDSILSESALDMDFAEMIYRLRFLTITIALMFFTIHSVSHSQPLNIVTLGTSLTATGDWPQRLQEALTECLGPSVTVKVLAQNGATSDWAISLLAEILSSKPDIILIELYANDAALNRFISVNHSKNNVSNLIKVIKYELPTTRVIFMAMNPLYGLRAAVRPFVEDYIQAHRSVALDAGFEFLDHRSRWLEMPSTELTRAIPDGLHPQAKIAARIMLPTLLAAITQHCG